MKIHPLLLFFAFFTILCGCKSKPDCTWLFNDLESEFNNGNFLKVSKLADSLKKSCPDDSYLSLKTDSLLQIAERISLDFPVSEEQFRKKLENYNLTFNDSLLNVWDKKKWLEWRIINGEKKYFNRSASNLMLLKLFYEDNERQILETGREPEMISRLEHTRKAMNESKNNVNPICPVNMAITYTITVDAAIEFIHKHANKSQPFFAVVWFGSPHNPHLATEQDRELYLGLEEKLQHYYGEITGMDRAFGKLRQELKTLGIGKNTILWYCSDNGGKTKEYSSTGGRGQKGQIYEGGLRVPAILEWPERIPKPRTTNMPCNTTDFYPTLLEITGVTVENQPPIDGISLLPLIDNKMKKRIKPMGFWQYPGSGKAVSSVVLMAELLKEQEAGITTIDTSKLDLNAGNINSKYPADIFPGHSAWLDWPYKLHRINTKNNDVRIELYNLEEDPEEKNNLYAGNQYKSLSMKNQLEAWLNSVIKSLNGNDYN